MDANQKNANQLTDQEITQDLIFSQEYLTRTYNDYANECATPNLRDEFLNILKDEHQIEAELCDEMLKRSWLQAPQADQQKAAQAKQKYQNALG